MIKSIKGGVMAVVMLLYSLLVFAPLEAFFSNRS